MRRAWGRVLIVALTTGALAVSMIGVAVGDATQPGGTFLDDDGSVHQGYIEAIAAEGITTGCNPPDHDRYCPGDPVTRGQMTAFLNRALDLSGDGASFTDTQGHIFEQDIDRLAAAGVTHGCNPPANDRFCPDAPVSRGQVAAFLVRALNLEEPGDSFLDTVGHVFEADISRLAAAGITRGCDPPANGRFCPDAPVSRAQMASFLGRALDLEATTPPPRPCVDINTASFEDLKQIIHISDGRAAQIILLRPFTSVDDMLRIDGIGPSRLADIKAQNLAKTDCP